MSSSNPRFRILIVDDHTLFRESVGRLLAAEPDCEVVGDCASIVEALRIVADTPIDVVLLDFDLGREKGDEFIVRAHELGFRGKVLIVTAGVSELEATELIQQGVSGIFTKHGSAASLAQGVRQVMNGNVWFDQRYLENAFRKHSAAPISVRERQVLNFVLEGLTNKEISSRLEVSESAVKASLQQLFQKTGVRTRSQLVRIALDRYKNLL